MTPVRQLPSCIHYDPFFCSRCLHCYACEHTKLGPFKNKANSIWWWKCPDGFQKPAYLDHGQFARLATKRSHKKVKDWSDYA